MRFGVDNCVRVLYNYNQQRKRKGKKMIRKTNKIECGCCGKEFYTEYYNGGSIEHNNYTNDRTMEIDVSRALNENGSSFGGLDYFFKNSIMLNGNHCNIKDHTLDIAMDVFECRIKWLRNKGNAYLAEYLEARRGDIKPEFNKVAQMSIDELQGKIDYIKEHKMYD
jgi:hypothetical protein